MVFFKPSLFIMCQCPIWSLSKALLIVLEHFLILVLLQKKKKQTNQEMFLDIWLFWCQEMCDGSYFGLFNLLQVFWWFHQWFLLFVLRF